MSKNTQRYVGAIDQGKQDACEAKANNNTVKDSKYYRPYSKGNLRAGWSYGWRKEFAREADNAWKRLFKRFRGRRIST